MRPLLVAACCLVPLAAAQAQTDACAKFKWPVALEQKAFGGAQLPTIKSGDQYPGAMSAVTVALSPVGEITYPVAPTHKAKSAAPHGAVLTAPPVAAAGVYQVTLSDEAFVDLVQNGKIVRSSAYSGVQGCPGVRKSVRFNLAAGPLTIEISDASAERINFDMVPAEAK